MVGRIPEKVCDGSLRQMLLIPRIFHDADTTLYYSFSRLSANIKPNYLKKKKKDWKRQTYVTCSMRDI